MPRQKSKKIYFVNLSSGGHRRMDWKWQIVILKILTNVQIAVSYWWYFLFNDGHSWMKTIDLVNSINLSSCIIVLKKEWI